MSEPGAMPMMSPRACQKVMLQATIAVFALLPLFAGVAGIWKSAGFLGLSGNAPADLDSHLRFLSGLFLAFGAAWYTCIPQIETKTERFRLLAILTICGGFARLLSLVVVGVPSTGHVLGLCMELVVVPGLVLWQGRVAALYEPNISSV